MRTIGVRVIAAMALLGAASAAQAAETYTGPIIDTHAHIRFPDQTGLSPTHPEGTKALRALDAAAKVSRSALIVMAWKGDLDGTRAQNDAVIAAAAADPAHFYAVPSVHPADGDAAMAELERLAKLGIKEIKLHPNSQKFDVADPAVAQVAAKCGALGLAILIDSYNPLDASEMGKLMVLALKQPKTKFVFAHMGFSQFRETLGLVELRKVDMHANVWFDVSAAAAAYAGSPVQAELVWTMRQHGMDRILFGSDWPVDTPAVAIDAIRRLGLTAAEQKLVLHDNAAALLGLR